MSKRISNLETRHRDKPIEPSYRDVVCLMLNVWNWPKLPDPMLINIDTNHSTLSLRGKGMRICQMQCKITRIYLCKLVTFPFYFACFNANGCLGSQ